MKKTKLAAELANGRLAMVALMAMLFQMLGFCPEKTGEVLVESRYVWIMVGVKWVFISTELFSKNDIVCTVGCYRTAPSAKVL